MKIEVFGVGCAKCVSLEKSVQKAALEAIEKGLVQSAHDCSEGGLAVALAECSISNPRKKLGARINLAKGNLRKDALLFGESQSRIIISAKKNNVNRILQIAKKHKAPICLIGKVEGNRLVIDKLVNVSVNDLYKAWGSAIEKHLKIERK